MHSLELLLILGVQQVGPCSPEGLVSAEALPLGLSFLILLLSACCVSQHTRLWLAVSLSTLACGAASFQLVRHVCIHRRYNIFS